MNKILSVVFLLSPFVLAHSFAMDIYVPALPTIADQFHATAGDLQFTLTIFMLTAGVMQLLAGSISDKYGRKTILLCCSLIYGIGSICCARSTSLASLIFFRMIQSVGSCGMMVVAFAVVRDLFSGVKCGQVYSYLNGIIAFSPMFAPFIGSYLDVYFGWPTTFYALLIIMIFAFLSLCILPETLLTKENVSLRQLFHVYFSVVKSPVFLAYTYASAAGLTYLYLFCSMSPFIIIRLLHISELNYGYYFCFMGISFFIGSFISGFILNKIGIFNAVVLGFFITLIGGVLMASWYFLNGLSINNFIWPMLLIGIGGTISMGAGAGGAMTPFTENIGSAAAINGSIRFVFSAIVGIFAVTSQLSSTLPLAVCAILFSVAGITTYYWKRQILALV